MVIDVAFAQVRPSPWREAVDLANMMLVLAVRTDAERVYTRALAYFTPDEIAEAFAAARGIASPTQLRSDMKRDGRDLLAQFRALGAGATTDLAAALGAAAGDLRRRHRPVHVPGARRTCTACSRPTEPAIADTPACGTETVMVLMAQSVPTATAVPCVALAARRLVGGWRARAERHGAVLAGLRPGRRQRRAGRSPPAGLVPDRRRTRGADRRGRLAPLRARRPAPAGTRIDPHVRVGGRLRDVPLRLRRRRERVGDRRPRRRARLPAASRSGRRGRRAQRLVAVRHRGAAVCGGSGDRFGVDQRRLVARRGRTRVRRHRPRRGHHDHLAASARHPPGVGHGAARRPARLGPRRRGGARAHRLGLGIRRAGAAHRRHRRPGDDGRRGRRSTSSPVPGRWRSASAPGSWSRRVRCGRCSSGIVVLRRYRELLRLARREGFGPFLLHPDRGRAPDDSQAVRLRRVLEEAGGCTSSSARSPPPASTCCPPTSAPSSAPLQNRVPPAPRDDIAAVLEAELGADVERCSPSSTGSRSRRPRSDRPTARRCTRASRVVVKVQRPGIEDVDRARPRRARLLADLAQRRTPFGRVVRSGELLGQFAERLRAELDFRREADAMAEMAACSTAPTSACRACIAACARAGCSCRSASTAVDLGRRRRPRPAAGVDRRRARRRSCCASTLDQVLRLGFFHADPHPGNVFVLADGTLGLIDFGAVGRLDPIQQAAVVDILAGARAARRRACCATASSGSPTLGETASPERLERALARLMADHVAARRRDRSRP